MTKNNEQKLRGKVALVTGGSRGIGAGIVARLGQEGAAVAFTYRNERAVAEALVSKLEAQGQRALAIVADSADGDAIRSAVKQAAATFGGLDILVNNAGVAVFGPLVEKTQEEIDRIIAVNVRGPVIATQEALRHMRDGGRIINIGSVNGRYDPIAGLSLYAMSKAASEGLTHGLARELGARNITINDLQPGPVDTDMNPAQGPMAASMLAQMALKRYGHTSEIAALVAFLAGPEGGYITGAGIRVDGGFSA